MGWIVHELGTRLEDGRYLHKHDGEQAKKSWDKRRPDYDHLLIEEDKRHVDIDRSLWRQHNREILEGIRERPDSENLFPPDK